MVSLIGQSVTNTITATLKSGTPQAVAFSVSDLPRGVTASFNVSSCNPTCSTTITFTASPSARKGLYEITVRGRAGKLTKRTEFYLRVTDPVTTFDFSLTNGGNKSVTQGQSTSNGVTATLSSGTSQTVSFSMSGIPTGATASYSGEASCNPTCSRTINIATSASTPTGPHTITVSGNGGGIAKTTSFTLTVNSPAPSTPSFNFSLTNGGNKSVTQGQSVSNDITATLTSGSAQAVSFSTPGLPTGATASYSTSTSCNPTCSRTLNITTSASTPTGPHAITVTGTGGGVTKTTSFSLTVNAPTTAVLDLTWMDNSSDESGFNIERRTGTNGTFAQIATAGANITSYNDTGLILGTTYCYRVSAFNSVGGSSYSNEGCGVARMP